MQANIVIVGATRGFETLTYSIPPALNGLIQPGHRVLAPLRSHPRFRTLLKKMNLA